jgi:nucleoside-diphosphate-sugar epimerase
MNVLITGITGRVGANLASALVSEGHVVRGLVWSRDPRTEKLKKLGVQLQSGSLTVMEDVQKAVDGVDIVYHLGAAFQGGGPFTEDEYFDINVGGTFHVLDATRRAGVQQLIYASTDALIQKYIPGGMKTPIIESIPKNPNGDYSITKSIGEDVCLAYWHNHGLPVTITRFSMIFGAGEVLRFPPFYLSTLHKNQSGLTSSPQEKDQLVIITDEHDRPYKKHVADVRDIVSGLVAVLGKASAFGEIIQLAGPEAFTWDKTIPYLAGALDMDFTQVSVEGTPTYYEFDLTRARSLIDFHPQYDIFRMIDDAIRFRAGDDIGLLPT